MKYLTMKCLLESIRLVKLARGARDIILDQKLAPNSLFPKVWRESARILKKSREIFFIFPLGAIDGNMQQKYCRSRTNLIVKWNRHRRTCLADAISDNTHIYIFILNFSGLKVCACDAREFAQLRCHLTRKKSVRINF